MAVTLPGEVALAVRGSWRIAGQVTLTRGVLSFPTVPFAPAIYRLVLTANEDGVDSVYVGRASTAGGA